MPHLFTTRHFPGVTQPTEPSRPFGPEAGRLLPGRLADVLVVRGDPTREITTLWDVLDVYQAGQRVERGVA